MSNLIYVVKKAEGKYEDYREYNVKAFTDKAIAEEYMISISGIKTPQFITPEFREAIDTLDLPEWDNKSLDESIGDWNKRNTDRENQFIIDEMHKQGFFVTTTMIDAYYDWVYKREDTEYFIEELKLE